MVQSSVVIPAYNEEKYIEKCLKSLEKQSFKKIEIIVVDDGSTDKTLEIIKRFKNVKIIEGQHRGPGFCRNLGAKEANGEILIFVDADMYFDKEYIKNLICPILNDKDVVGTTHDNEVATNTKNKWSSLWGKLRVSKENAKDVKIFRAIRKVNFLKMGGFDSRYGYADDQTFWYKYQIKPIVAENTICYHRNPESLKESYKQAKWIGASWKERFLFFRVPILNYICVLIFFFLLPEMILLKALKSKVGMHKKFGFIDLVKFYSMKFSGYGIGVARGVFLGKVWK